MWWLLGASVPTVAALVVVGVVRVGCGVLLAVATVVHAGSGARSALQVRITGTRGQMGRASSKVVCRGEVGCDRDGLVAGSGHIPSIGTTGVGAVRRTKRAARMLGIERIPTGDCDGSGIAFVHGESSGRGRLPVDGLEAVFELTRSAKLPFADNGPDGGSTDDAAGGHDKRDDYGLGKEGSTLILGSVWLLGIGGWSGGGGDKQRGATVGLCGEGLNYGVLSIG